MEIEYVILLTNQGLAVLVSVYLVRWVTQSLGSQITLIAESQVELCKNQLTMAVVLDRIALRSEGDHE